VRVRKPISAFDPVLSNNIFRARRSPAPGSNPAATASAPAAAPLKLTLSGVFIAGETAFAFVVGPDGRSEQVYKRGDCVPRVGDDEEGKECSAGQGRLTRVQADRIVVTFGGQPTVFLLEQGSDEQPTSPAARPVVAATARPATGPVTPGAAFPSTRNGNTISTRVPSAEVDKAFENFAEIIKQARVVPYSKDGATIGFQIQNIAAGSVFQKLGLQNFDVIKGVNGESVTTADQALKLFTLFRNEKEVVLDIQRQEEQLKMAYAID
ncbi:MAG TPA: hypothetical protein VF678_01235, partial [bacterium]